VYWREKMLIRKIYKSKWVKGILLIAYLGFIGYFGFISKIAGRTRSNIKAYNLVPFYSIGKYLKVSDFSSLVEFVINILGNIIVFMPVGIFIPYLFHNKTWAYKINFILIIGFLFSFGVESIQFIISVGVFDVDDLILNTLGALIGWKLYCRYMTR
jgi:glycopeptide antibiotics resistance protein